MTSDTDDDNDTIKLEISKGDNQFFEKGLGALLSNPNFLLLYVPENGAKMQVIRPTSDPYHRRRMIRRINEAEGIPSFYYALSHLWGITENNRHYWDDIGEYVNDEDGHPMKPVSMRPEKRDTLLALLKDHLDSYWWIDVLCARTETPLDIMGDIYACCLECIAMIDCEPGVISQLHQMGDFKRYLYKRSIVNYEPHDIAAARQDYEQCYRFTGLMYRFIQSRWWKRVWTWQEMALPFGEVRLMAETGTHKAISSLITMRELVRNYNRMSRIMQCAEYHCWWTKRSERHRTTKFKRKAALEDWYCEVRAARTYNSDRIYEQDVKDWLFNLLWTWGNCPRRCMDPVDYVYGVLGIFQFEIPRMDNPDAVWKLFLSKMDKLVDELLGSFPGDPRRIRISDRAYQLDLRKAKDMADVYKNLLLESNIRYSPEEIVQYE
ncbi:hypothetical protein O0I10_012364 [Lichtheimia ornata]|uniref:Heterokaryon incompatibility domain-containing protein n=1 Tax=Lichtheimia ornata TaxID=688661 RepID=A0AAD7UT59_9FUNG|nr:uncharacterized protein O0I10_012364 [Lichtheimia ornata]KAJ8652020.1 hypothetical protein O0I10_012364 [Lichtheimia ornata]